MNRFTHIILLFGCLLSCVQLEVADSSNENIPNYSFSLLSTSVNPNMNTHAIAINDDNIVMAVENEIGQILIINYSQSFNNATWEITEDVLETVGEGSLLFFDKQDDSYIIGFISNLQEFEIVRFDLQFNVISQYNNYESFIDTFYNDVDSVIFNSFTNISSTDEILLAGNLFSQQSSYSCVLSIDKDFNPQWIKTYFESSTISDLVSLNRDTFLVIQNSVDGADLIVDNKIGSAYHKFNLSSDYLYFGFQSFNPGNLIFLSGIFNSIGRLLEVDLQNNSAFVNEVEIYPVVDLRSLYLSRNNIITAGIQQEGDSSFQFSSELYMSGSIWCHKYIDEEYIKILDVTEMPGKGIVISSIVEINNKYYVHLTRIDEEGATFINAYSENCI